ncbi:MAG: energy transducer TonB [Bacteroidaceae bacterium]|nr:energy transducer TonB [Bacteroidaceae bacterium]
MNRITAVTIVAICLLLFHFTACDAQEISNVSVNVTSNGYSGTSSTRTHYNGPIYTTADEMPRFPGGEEALFEYIKNAIRYPKKCREARIEGCTSVIFVVTSKGKVKDVKVRKSSGNKKLDKEALRVIRKMPRLTPAVLEGKNVSVMLTVPVTFRIDKEKQ